MLELLCQQDEGIENDYSSAELSQDEESEGGVDGKIQEKKDTSFLLDSSISSKLFCILVQ